MRILLLTQLFQPEPAPKGLAFAQALQARGHQVEVLTGFPNYPGGSVYPGYRVRPWQREILGGVPVTRVPLYPSHDSSALKRTASYLSFGFSAAALGPWLVGRPEVVYVYNLVTLGWAARFLRARRGARIVLDVQDLWPDSVSGSGMMSSRPLLALLSRWCRREYRSADHLVALSPGMKQALCRMGVPEARVRVIYNWCDETQLASDAPEPTRAREPSFEGRFNVLFAGTMGHTQALDAVIDAARLVSAEAPEVLFSFVGGGVEVPRLAEKAQDLPNVQFLPRRPFGEIGPLLRLADALLVHLRSQPLSQLTIPSKIQAYMHAGRPLLNAVRGDAADLVSRAGAGLCCEPEDPRSIADAVLHLRQLPREEREAMGRRGAAFYQDHLSLRAGTEAFEQLFREVLGR